MKALSLRSHRVVRAAAASGAGLLGVALVASLVAFGQGAAEHVPPAEVADPVQQVTVVPAQEQSVCPAPARLTDPETVGDAEFAPTTVATTDALRAGLTGDGSATLGGLDGAGATELDPPGAGAAALSTVDDPAGDGALLAVRPGTGERPRAAASAGSVTTEGDLRGLAAATCTRPDVSHWLVGGSTEVGSSSQLVLQNPGLTPATVQVTVWGQGGPVVVEGGGQQLVGPGERVVTLLEASAPEQRRTVVHVEASGGLVAAYLQHNSLDGLVPLGVDHVVPGAAPARQVALAGVESEGEAVDDPHAPLLRLLAPGDEGGTARVHVQGPDGPVTLRGAEDVALTAGVVTDVSLGGLPPGRYAVSVDADVPVVAGARTERRGGPSPDLLDEQHQYDAAWIAAAPVGQDGPTPAGTPVGQVALVPGTSSSLTLAAVPAAAATAEGATDEGAADEDAGRTDDGGTVGLLVRAWGPDGDPLGERTVEVAAGTTATLDPTTLGATDPAEPGGDPGDVAPVAAFVTVDVAGTSGVAPFPVWSVLATAGAPGDDDETGRSLVSVLVPAQDPQTARTIGVHASDTAGLG
ncbi:hypothetical protein IF650_09425 [Cellulosimicrobium terreum]|nr:hypothetical protein [Cellulosimicrobium terreum]